MVVPNKILFINDWAKGNPYSGAHIATEYLAAAIKKTKILNPVKYYLPQPQHKNEVIKDGIICFINAIKIAYFSIFNDPLLYGFNINYIQPMTDSKNYKFTKYSKLWSIYYNAILYFPLYILKRKNSKKPKLYLFVSKETLNKLGKNFDDDGHKELLYPMSKYIYKDQKVNFDRKDKRLVLTISRYDKTKKLDVVGKISNLLPDFKFVVIGYKSDFNRYYSYLRGKYPKVKFLFNISESQKVNLLKSSSVYLHPAENEPWGLSIIEAMKFGCIPAVHNSGGNVEKLPINYRAKTINEFIKIIKGSHNKKERSKIIKLSNNFNGSYFDNQVKKLLKQYIKELKESINK